jgi:hypothetical protein
MDSRKPISNATHGLDDDVIILPLLWAACQTKLLEKVVKSEQRIPF